MSICLVIKSSGLMTVFLDFLEFRLRRIWGLASWTLMIDARACHWVKGTLIKVPALPSTKLPSKGFLFWSQPHLTEVPGHAVVTLRAARRFQCLYSETKWVLIPWSEWTSPKCPSVTDLFQLLIYIFIFIFRLLPGNNQDSYRWLTPLIIPQQVSMPPLMPQCTACSLIAKPVCVGLSVRQMAEPPGTHDMGKSSSESMDHLGLLKDLCL